MALRYLLVELAVAEGAHDHDHGLLRLLDAGPAPSRRLVDALWAGPRYDWLILDLVVLIDACLIVDHAGLDSRLRHRLDPGKAIGGGVRLERRAHVVDDLDPLARFVRYVDFFLLFSLGGILLPRRLHPPLTRRLHLIDLVDGKWALLLIPGLLVSRIQELVHVGIERRIEHVVNQNLFLDSIGQLDRGIDLLDGLAPLATVRGHSHGGRGRYAGAPVALLVDRLKRHHVA